MKRVRSVIAVVMLGILAGCANSKVAYRSKATLTPVPNAAQYDVAFVIEDVSDPANPHVFSSPRVRLVKGQEGTISFGDETSGITCTALVDDASGKSEAWTTVAVKKGGKVVWSEEQTIALSK